MLLERRVEGLIARACRAPQRVDQRQIGYCMRAILRQDAHRHLIGVQIDPGRPPVNPELNANLVSTAVYTWLMHTLDDMPHEMAGDRPGAYVGVPALPAQTSGVSNISGG